MRNKDEFGLKMIRILYLTAPSAEKSKINIK